jgi:hypothetical protein
VLYLAEAAPVVGVAENDLDRVLADAGRDVGERRHGHVAGQRRVHAGGTEAATDLGHAVDAGGRVLQVAPAAQLFRQGEAHLDRGLHRPRAVGVHAQRNAGAEGPPELLDGLDLDPGIEHACLELDVAEAVLLDHPLDLADERLGVEGLPVFVRPRVGAFTATPCVFVERIGRERDLVPDPAPQKVAGGTAHRPADQVEARDLDGGV